MSRARTIFFTIIGMAIMVVLFPYLPTIIQLALVGSVALPIISYNSLIAKKNYVSTAESSIDVMLKKRFDLIPNLVSSVRVHMNHEKALLAELSRLRTQLSTSELELDERMRIENQLTGTIASLLAIAEKTPELSANAQFLNLQRSLSNVEEQISAARRSFNAAATDYNNSLEMIPSNVVAALMNMQPLRLFETTRAERASIDVHQLFSE